MNSLIGLKNTIIILNAIQNKVKASKQNRESYINEVSVILKYIGEGLRILQEHYEELQSQDLIEQFKLYDLWFEELNKLDPKDMTKFIEHYKRMPKVGALISVSQQFGPALVFIEVLARPQGINDFNRSYANLAKIKIPKEYKTFDIIFRSMISPLNSIHDALNNIFRCRAKDMKELDSAIMDLAPLFKFSLEQFDKIIP